MQIFLKDANTHIHRHVPSGALKKVWVRGVWRLNLNWSKLNEYS